MTFPLVGSESLGRSSITAVDAAGWWAKPRGSAGRRAAGRTPRTLRHPSSPHHPRARDRFSAACVPHAPRLTGITRSARGTSAASGRAGPVLVDPSVAESSRPDHLIGAQQDRRRDRQAEGLGGLEVDDQLELRGLLDRKLAGLGAPEDLVHKSPRAGTCQRSWAHTPWGHRPPRPPRGKLRREFIGKAGPASRGCDVSPGDRGSTCVPKNDDLR